jgi:phage-related protein
MSQNYEVALQRMGNAAEVAMIKAGKQLLDEFGGVANGIAAVFKSLGQSIDAGAFDPIINALEVFGQSMAGTLKQIAQNLPEALSGLDFSDLIRSFENIGDEMGDAFEQIFGYIDLSTPEGLRDALQMIVNGVAALTNVTAGIVDGLDPVFSAFGGLARSADSAGEDAQRAVGQFMGAAELIVTFGTKLGGALIALQEYGASFESIFDVVIGTIRTAFNAFQIAVDGVAATFWEIMRELASGLATVLPDSMGGSYWKSQVEGIDALLNGFAQRQRVNFDDLSAGLHQAGQGLGLIKDEAGGTTEALNSTADGLGGIADAAGHASGQLSPYGDGMQYVAQAARNLGLRLDEAQPKSAEFAQEIQGQDWASPAERAQGYKKVIDELGNVTYVQVGEKIKKTNDEVARTQKEMEAAAKKAVEYDLKLREIESKERIAYIEAKFKVDEAQIKADAERVVAAFESINTAIQSTGETLSSLVGNWAGMAGTFEGQKLWGLIEAEEARRKQAFEQQKELVGEQIKYMQAKVTAMARGDVLIKVEAGGLEPELEKIFYEILRKCQVKASEQGLELLLGAM